jgi:hypothetical protein
MLKGFKESKEACNIYHTRQTYDYLAVLWCASPRLLYKPQRRDGSLITTDSVAHNNTVHDSYFLSASSLPLFLLIHPLAAFKEKNIANPVIEVSSF